MLREIIQPKTPTYKINIPPEYINQKIEILVRSVEKNNNKKLSTIELIEKTAGILSDKNIDPLEWQKNIRDEWQDRNVISD
ncbi:MAG: hypothetical protein DRQ51_10180 [Gammaproteobacteria bacterium]|nr:MAG: hypothetical protein DRQ51_10180 [Gammaproteobacteria bacterium]